MTRVVIGKLLNPEQTSVRSADGSNGTFFSWVRQALERLSRVTVKLNLCYIAFYFDI